tara:strand:+ start:4624 stop:6726 length:2103 start_codon:yes stop_codon:yes gene_type:complete
VSQEKHAYCFLTRGELNQSFLWERYFANATNKHYKIFTHAKIPSEVKHPLFSNTILDKLIPTNWGGLDLVHATLNLFEEAYEWGADKFILLSDSCIPLYTYQYTYKEIKKLQKNHIKFGGVDAENENEFMRDIRDRYGAAPSLKDFVPLESFKKGSQWLMLNRWTCQTILENDKTKYFEGMFAPDEHYFQTMAEYYGYLTEEHSENKSLTFVNWNNPHDWRHPIAYQKVTGITLKNLRAEGHLFARKITKNCVFEFTNNTQTFPVERKYFNMLRNIKGYVPQYINRTTKNKLITSIVNDDFVIGALVLLHSIYKNFRDLETTDVKLYYNSKLKYGGLSRKNQNFIKKLFPSVLLQDVQSDVYKNWRATSDKIRTTYVKLHMFEERNYDKIIFLDTDTLVIRDFSVVFDWIGDDIVYGSGPVEDSYELEHIFKGTRSDFINAGFIGITKSMTSGSFVYDLEKEYKFSEGENEWMIDKGMHENKLIVEVFKGKLYAPDWKCNYRPGNAEEWREWKVLHWAGTMKPWSGTCSSIKSRKGCYGGEESIKRANKIWNSYHYELLKICEEKGITDLQALLKVNEDDIDFFFAKYYRQDALSKCVEMSKTNKNKAEEMFDLLLSIHKDWPALHREIGAFYHKRKKDVKKAMLHLKKACSLNKKSPRALEMLGDLLIQIGNKDAACTVYRESHKLKETSRVARKLASI